MKKGLEAARLSGSVHVKFNVSKDVASHIQQSVVSSWKRMQDLGVVSIQLDKEQLECVNSGLYTELCNNQSIEHQHCTQLSWPSNCYAESMPCCSYRNTRGKKRSQVSGSRSTKRRCNDGLVYQCSGKELPSSTVTVVSVAQEGTISRYGDNTSQRCNQDHGVASLSSNEHVLRVPSPQLPRHMTSYISANNSIVSNTASAGNPFTADMLQLKLGTANAVHFHDLPPPSTPVVPKRRKRRKLDGSSQAALAKSPLCTTTDHSTVPVRVNGGIETPSKLRWPNCINWPFHLNGHYPPQFNSPVFSHYAVSNAQLMPLSYANPRSRVPLANYAKRTTESHMVLDSSLPVSSTVTSEPKNFGALLMERSVPARSSHPLQPLVGSAACAAQNQCGLLHRSVVLDSSGSSHPTLSSHCSQGTLELRHHNPEICGTAAETKDSYCAERSCRSADSRSYDVSSALATERNLCSQISMSDSAVVVKPTETLSSPPLFSEVNSLESLAPVLKSSETVVSSPIEINQCSVISTASVCSSSKSANVMVHSETVDSILPVSSSPVIKQRKSDTVNGYHLMSDYTHRPVSVSVSKVVSKPGSTSNDIDIKHGLLTPVNHSSTAEPASDKEVLQVANKEHYVNIQSRCEAELSLSSNNWTISG